MRKYLFFAGLLAFAATFTACSSDDEAVTPEQKLEGNAFMAVQLVTPSSTRAADDYDKTTDAENALSNVKFFFYKSNGDFVVAGNNVSKTELGDGESSSSDAVSKIYGAVVALQTNSELSDVSQVLALANIDNFDQFNGLSLDEAKKLYTSTVGDATTNKFPMAGSVYLPSATDANKGLWGTYDCSGKLKENKQEALDEPAVIYIERLAAKISVDASAISAEGEGVKDNVYTNGSISEQELTVNIVGWALNCLEPNEYFIKNLGSDLAEDTYFTGWNDNTNKRCYWAEDAHYSTTGYDQNGFTNTTGSNLSSKGILEYVTAASVTGATDKKPASMYCKENTYNNAEYSSYLSASTSLLVIAQIGDGSKTYVRFGGNLYLEDDYKAAAINASALDAYYYIESSTAEETKYASIGKVVEIQGSAEKSELTDGKVIIQIPANTDVYKYDGANYTKLTSTEVTAINTTLATNSVGYGFNGGLMYYSVPIKHLVGRDGEKSTFAQPTAIGQYGVVRNHSYSISLNSISGLGHAIWNPDEHIVPVDGDTNYYLAAKLNVQAWRIVPTQGVDLGK